MLDARYSQAQVDAFCDDLQLFRIGYSWGGPVSLVVPYDLASMRSRERPQLRAGHLVRFSTGLEAPQALIADLQAALQRHLPT
jgi:cystathionine beta-lyase